MYLNIIDNVIEIANIKYNSDSIKIENIEDIPYYYINNKGILTLDTIKKQEQLDRLKYKENRSQLVNQIEVTYNNIVYQGDEKSQDRLIRAITIMNDIDTIQWIAKDNSIQILTKFDLLQIAKLSLDKQTNIWIN